MSYQDYEFCNAVVLVSQKDAFLNEVILCVPSGLPGQHLPTTGRDDRLSASVGKFKNVTALIKLVAIRHGGIFGLCDTELSIRAGVRLKSRAYESSLAYLMEQENVRLLQGDINCWTPRDGPLAFFHGLVEGQSDPLKVNGLLPPRRWDLQDLIK